MRHEEHRIRHWATVAAIVIGIAVALPILALVVFVGRGLVFVGALGIFAVGAVAWAVSPRFREWLEVWTEPEVSYKGLRLATDVGLSPNHTWARIDGPEASVGVDDLAQAVLGPVDEVELPAIGFPVHRGELLFRLDHGHRHLWARSPIDGKIVAVNEEVADDPGRVNDSPFDEWIVRVESDDARRQKRRLLRGSRVRQWFRDEVDDLLALLAPAPSFATLPDGGIVVDDLHRLVSDDAWDGVVDRFFDGRS